MTPRAGGPGIVLPAVLVVGLALALLAHGALVLAGHQLRAARVAEGVVVARAAAQAGLGATLSGPTWPWSDTVPVLAVRSGATLPGLGEAVAVEVVRLAGRTGWLVRSTGRSAADAQARAGALIRVFDPVAWVVGRRGVVEVGPAGTVVGEARVGTAWGRAGESCPPRDRLWRGLVPPRLPGVLRVDRGWDRAAEDADLLVAAAAALPAGSPGPWAVGDPAGACRGPECAGATPALRVPGDLELLPGPDDGAIVRGLIVADGEVRVRPRVRVHGVVVAGGRLVLEGDSELVGTARAEAGLEVAAGARVVPSPCTAVRVLAGLPELRRGLPVPGGRSLGPL